MALTYRDTTIAVEDDFEFDYATGSSALRVSKVFRNPQQFAEIALDQDVKGGVSTTYKLRSTCDCPTSKCKWNTTVTVSSAGRGNGRCEVLPKNFPGAEIGVEGDVDVVKGTNATNEYTAFWKYITATTACTGSLKVPVTGSPVIEKTAAYTFRKYANGRPTLAARAAFANAKFSALEVAAFVKCTNGWALLKIDQDRSIRFAASRALDAATDVGFDAQWSSQSPVSVMFRKYLPAGKMIKVKVSNKGRVDGVYAFGLGNALVSLNAVWGNGNPITFGARITF